MSDTKNTNRASAPDGRPHRGKPAACFLIFISAFFFCGAAFGALPPRFGGTLRVGVQNVSSQLLPARAVTDDELMIVNAVFEPLIKLDSAGAPVPFLLDKLPVESDDKLTYYFKLKDGVLFHNRKKLDSADVIFTIQEVVKDRRAAYAWIFGNIAGAAEYRGGKSKSLEGLKVVDSQRFQIRLKKPDPHFVKLLSLPAASVTAAGIDHAKTPVGTGPFAWREKKPGREISLAANPAYHGGRPYLDGIVFRIIGDPEDAMLEFKTGRLDAVALMPGALAKLGDNASGAAVENPVKRIVFLDMNPNNPPLDNKAVRKQVVFAIDRASIIKVILSGEGGPENYIPEKQRVKPEKAAETTTHALWYLKDDPVQAFVAERLKVVLFDKMRFVLKLAAKDEAALYDDGQGAPSFRLRSLPILANMQQTVQSTLFNYPSRSIHSAMMVRHGTKQASFDDVPVAFIYSRRRALYVSGGFTKPGVNDRGEVDFAEMRRGEKPE